MGNAIKFTATGEVVGRASLENETEVLLRFTVHDTGIGIPEDKIGMIFGKFHTGRCIEYPEVRRQRIGPGHLQAIG